jgi:hypothetical protein
MTTTAYRVTYERVGRRGGRDGSPAPEPLIVEADSAETLAWQVEVDIRPYLASQNVEVLVDLDKQRGYIFAGINNGGSFTLERLQGAEGGDAS